MRKIPFVKMSGSGNDFIIIDHRRKILKEDDPKDFVARICQHRLSVGGDGVILIETSKTADFRWRLFNADGSEAEFSGNGGRCAARFAYLKKISGKKLSFETLAGLVKAEVKKDQVKIQFPEIKDLRPNLSISVEGQTLQGHFINTGVPHVVHYVGDVDQVETVSLGRKIRHHSLFQPAGTNVNFVMMLDPHTVRIRTYERGVEDETLACGSGSVAAALITGALGKGQSPMTVIQRSGKSLGVYFRIAQPLALPGTGPHIESTGMAFSEVFLEGDAMVVYEGEMWEEAWK
jgi:diaminopimelate epimerase